MKKKSAGMLKMYGAAGGRSMNIRKIEAFVQHKIVRINMRTNQFLRITQNTHFLLSEAHYPSLGQNQEFWLEYLGMSKF